MPKPELMSWNSWHERTDIRATFGMFKHDRAKLAKIDLWLSTWDTGRDFMPADNVEKTLIGMIYACKEWLKNKGTKSSDNAVRRRTAVQQLLRQAETRLLYEIDPDYRAAYAAFHANKARGKLADQVIPLAHGYEQEHAGKAKGVARIGATTMGAAIERMEDKKSQAAFRAIAGVGKGDEINFKEFTPQQYAKLEAWLLKKKGTVVKNSEGDVTLEVKELTYHSKNDRIKHMMVPRERRMYAADGQPFSTRNAPARMFIYAVDEYGNFYAQPGSTGVLHHSSFNRGKGVICAGCIQMANGIPYYISNESGHYKPSKQALRNAVSLLVVNYDIPCDNLWVVDMTARDPAQIHYPNGRAFLDNRPSARCPNIRNGNPAMP